MSALPALHVNGYVPPAKAVLPADPAKEIEYCADAFNDLLPKLRANGFNTCARKLDKHLELFHEQSPPPYDPISRHLPLPEATRDAFDASATRLAAMHKLLWKTIEKKCSYGEHSALMREIYDINQRVQKRLAPELLKMGLEYYEFTSLQLELESQLGMAQPETDGKNSDRRRRQPKDPQKLEQALRGCLEKIQEIRPLIVNDERQERLDKIVSRVTSALRTLPAVPTLSEEPDANEIDRRNEILGNRIAKLLGASAQMLKVSKWVRQVDLFEIEPSSSKKGEILRRFSTLAALANGLEPETGRS